jgi:hypothetical protein
MFFQVVAIQPSERWTCAMRNASMWPMSGLGQPVGISAAVDAVLARSARDRPTAIVQGGDSSRLERYVATS